MTTPPRPDQPSRLGQPLSPSGFSLAQLNAEGLAKDSSVLTVNTSIGSTNTQLSTGVPPAVPNVASGSKILQSPGTYTLYTFAGAGRIWAANVSLGIGCTGGSGTQQAYAQVLVQAGSVPLAIVEACLAGTTSNDSNTDSQTFPGFSVPNGTVVQLDVNGGVGISGGVCRGSGLVVVSVP